MLFRHFLLSALAALAASRPLDLFQVKLCNDPYYEGDCFDIQVNPARTGICTRLQGSLYYKQLSSISVGDEITCYAFEGDNCDGDSLPDIQAPGIDDLGSAGWDNRVRSVKCAM
ncbi:hypothetical protein EJ06DRAFT_556629 [Trichodelitschia bisporula]|uniref:Beta/gamma crystallin 'Greek key' domain-containing protein n=1 Tax=Trichodelitschia bisporula TaxID=703511 RepID=A0A6G1HX30_9PEZI|nr:hypothetical protein EJ06DRAFT_556629 [Trichodelitschia bisporula]